MLFQKCLRFSKSSLSQTSSGKLVTIVDSELHIIEAGFVLIPYIIISPIIVCISFGIIAIYFKEAAAVGFIIYLVIVLGEILSAKCLANVKYFEGLHSDKRLKLISEAVDGIRTIKAYGWEMPYKDLINKYRKLQISQLFKNHLIQALGAGLFQSGGYVIAIWIFSYHFFMGKEFIFSETILTMSLLAYLSFTAIYFSFSGFWIFATFFSALERISEIFNMAEVDESVSLDDKHLPDGTRVLALKAIFSWNQRNINKLGM